MWHPGQPQLMEIYTEVTPFYMVPCQKPGNLWINSGECQGANKFPCYSLLWCEDNNFHVNYTVQWKEDTRVCENFVSRTSGSHTHVCLLLLWCIFHSDSKYGHLMSFLFFYNFHKKMKLSSIVRIHIKSVTITYELHSMNLMPVSQAASQLDIG